MEVVSRLTGSLNVSVLGAEGLRSCDLNGLSDPYVVLEATPPDAGKHGKARTSVRKKTLSPEWNEALTLGVTRATALGVWVKDWDLLSADDTCGTAELDLLALPELEAGRVVRQTLALSPQGSLALELQFVNDRCLFGLDLTSTCLREGVDVPIIVTRCVEAVETHGLEHEGIYRVPGRVHAVQDAKERFIADSKAAEFKDTDLQDINIVASLLKLYLRELPDPLIPAGLHQYFAEATRIHDEEGKRQAFLVALAHVPAKHLSTLRFLFGHLQRVQTHEAKNKMTAGNIGTCFGPTLMPAPAGDPGVSLLDMSGLRAGNDVVAYLVEHPDMLEDRSAVETTAATEGIKSVDPFTGHFAGGQQKSRVRLVFEKYEERATGHIPKTSFHGLCYDLGIFVEPEELDSQWAAVVAGGDAGHIDWCQFHAWWNKHHDYAFTAEQQQAFNQALDYFQYFDVNSDGKLSLEEFGQLHTDLMAHGYAVDKDAQASMDALDSDRDGSISFSEFRAWLLGEQGSSVDVVEV